MSVNKQIDYLSPLGLNIKTLKVFGAWITPDSSLAYKIYGHATQFFLTTIFAINTLLPVPQMTDLEELMRGIAISLTLIGFAIKVYNLYIKRFKIRAFAESLNTSMNQFSSDVERQVLIARIKSARRIIVSQFVIFVLAGSTAIIPIFSSQPKVPYQLFYPDWRVGNTSLYVNCVYQTIATMAGSICNVSTDMFVPYFLLVIAGHVDILASNLRDLAQNSGDYTTNKRELLRCVEKHRSIMKLVSDLSDIFSIVTFMQILLSGVINCGLLFLLSTTSPFQNPGMFYRNFFYTSAMLLQIFIPCYTANELKYRSEALKDSAFNCNWINTEIRFKKLLLFLMLRFESPIQIQAGGILTLGLEIFTKISNFTYSSFTLLRRINSRVG